MFGTIYKPGQIRLAVKIIEEENQFIHCQSLSTLEHFIVPKTWFYPYGSVEGMMLLNQQIEKYQKLPTLFVSEQYRKSKPEKYS